MDIYLYSFNKRNNSTKIPSGGVKVSGQIKEPSSLINPSISFGGVEPEYNYAHIPRFGRYYWIREWTFTGGLWVASMEVDVLASWKSYIGSSTQFVVRSSAAYDGEVIDSMYPATNKATTVQTYSEDPWSAGASFHPHYIVGILGNGEVFGAVTYYCLSGGEFLALGQYLLGSFDYMGTDFGPYTLDYMKSAFNPIQYITSIVVVPFYSSYGSTDNLKFGWWELPITAEYAEPSREWVLNFEVPKHPQANRGGYLNGPPYSSYTLYIPQFGQIPLDGNVLSGVTSISCKVKYDVRSSNATLTVFAGDCLLYTATAFFGANVQIGQISTNKMEQIGALFGMAAAMFNGDIGGAISGGVDALKSAYPQVQSKGSSGVLTAFETPPRLDAKFMEITAEDNSNIGRPYYKPARLSSLPGFIMTREADIAAPATAEEITRIENELNGGIFYE